METQQMFVTIAVAVIGSGAVFGFIQFLITRKDNKNEKFIAIDSQFKNVHTKFDTFEKSVNDRFDKMASSVDAKFDRVEQAIDKIGQGLKDIHTRLSVDVQEVYDKIEEVYDHIDRTQAVNARIRILQASDEIRLGGKHSKEFFDQLSDDITLYENYCKEHTNFKNNRAIQAITNINSIYQERLHDNDFI